MTIDRATGETTPSLYFEIDGKRFHGWQDCTIVRSAEHCPQQLTATLCEHFPGEVSATVSEGMKIVVTDDLDTVFTGWIDTIADSFPDATISIQCSSLCVDIVDSSNAQKAMSIGGGNIVALAKQLVEPFGVTVVDETTDAGPMIPAHPVNATERVFDVLERLARFCGVLIYDNQLGELVIANIGTKKMATKIQQGENVLRANFRRSLEGRFAEYKMVWTSSINVAGGISTQSGVAYDPVVKALGRPRYLVSISNQADMSGQNVAQRRAQWEANRRLGRGYALQVSILGWRDADGALWQPNSTAVVDCPRFGISDQPMVIAQVQQSRTLQGGTVTDLTLYPRAAFDIAPPEGDALLNTINNPGQGGGPGEQGGTGLVPSTTPERTASSPQNPGAYRRDR